MSQQKINWSKEQINITSHSGFRGMCRVTITHDSGFIGEGLGVGFQSAKIFALKDLEQKLIDCRTKTLPGLEEPVVIPKTSEDLAALIEQWKADPSWDLATTEGFEEFKEFLEGVQTDFEAEQLATQKAKEKDLRDKWYSLELNEQFKLDDWTWVRRVPGGWVMTTEMVQGENGIAIGSVFIPQVFPNV